MFLYGGGGHAKVIMELLEIQGISICGIFDDNPNIKNVLGFNVLGKFNPEIIKNDQLIISIGDNKTRSAIAQKISLEFGIALHKKACISAYSKIESGTVAMQNSVVQTDSVIGKHVIINTGALIEHECIVEDFAHIAPSATLCGNVHIGEGTLIGAGSVVIPGVKIGKWCVIGAGSVILSDIPDYTLVYGNPARIIKLLK